MRGREVYGTGAWRGAVAGAACGALATALFYLYHEVTGPSPYNIILIGHAPVFMTFGGMAGLLVRAMRDSQTDGRGPAPPRLKKQRKELGEELLKGFDRRGEEGDDQGGE